MGEVDRRGQENAAFTTFVGLDSKRNVASFSTISTDLLRLQVA